MQKVDRQLSTYRRNEDKQLMKWLIGLLNWFSSKIQDDNEQVVIVLTKKHPPTFYRSSSSIRYIPPQTTIEKVTLKTSDWKNLNNIKGLKLEDFKTFIQEYVPGIEVHTGIVGNNIEGLIIDWNGIKITFIEDDRRQENSKRIPIPYRVLTFLVKNPSCIVKGKESFSCKLGMKLDEENKIIYVGEGATYIFNENGFNYIGQSNLNEFKLETCRDRIGIIEHREKDYTRTNFKSKVNKYLYM